MQYVYTKTYNFLFLSNFQDQCGLIEKYLIQLRLRTTNSLRRPFQRLFWPWMNATFAINDSFLYGHNLQYKNSSFLLKKKWIGLLHFCCTHFDNKLVLSGIWKCNFLKRLLSTWMELLKIFFSLYCFLLTLNEITYDKLLTSGAKISFDRYTSAAEISFNNKSSYWMEKNFSSDYISNSMRESLILQN